MQGQGEAIASAARAAPGDPDRDSRAGLTLARLSQAYGRRVWLPQGDPLDELISTILSQHTSDVNSHRAFASLRASFPKWESVLSADVADVADAIRSGGLARVKAPRIKALLADLAERYGSVSLDFLRDLSTAEARSILEAIPGVGPKTAACVLLFSLGRPVIPVDTHVHRVSRRIGLAPLEASPEEVEAALEAQYPPEASYECHVTLVTHGRRTCRAQRPLCERCPVGDLCDYYRSSLPPS